MNMSLAGCNILRISIIAGLQLLVMLTACMDDNELTLVFPTSSGERALHDNGEIVLPDKNIEMALWDWGDIDHDTVSVFINNRTIVKELFIKGPDEKYVTRATLDKARNDLTILTPNEGTTSPNTLAFSIKSGEVYIQKDIKAGMATNELYRLVVE